MKPHFLQSKAWEDFQRTEGFETVRREGGDYAFMAIIKPTSLGNYLFLPYGPTLKNKKALKNAIDEIKKVQLALQEELPRLQGTLKTTVSM